MRTNSVLTSPADSKKRRAVRPANLGLALAIVECFAAEGVALSAFGLQHVLLAESIPSNKEALRLAVTGAPLTPEKINALLVRLESIPFSGGAA